MWKQPAQNNQWVSDPLIETEKEMMKEAYDTLFRRITESIKGSNEHKKLLKEEHELNQRSHAFIEKNKRYFDAKRQFLMRHSNINRDQIMPLDREERKVFSSEYEPVKTNQKRSNQQPMEVIV